MATKATDEQLLVEFAASGAPELIAELHRRYSAKIRGFIYRFIRKAELTEDLSQNTWLKIIRNAGQFRGDAKFASWALAIAMNTVLDFRRDAWYGREVQPDEDLFRLVAGGVDAPDQVAATNEVKASLYRAIAGLPAKLRSIVELVDIRDVDYSDASRLLGIPYGSVQSGRHRAVNRLRLAMGAVSFTRPEAQR